MSKHQQSVVNHPIKLVLPEHNHLQYKVYET